MTQAVSSYSANSELLQATQDVKSAIAVKMFKESQANIEMAGDIIQDTVEISQKAMNLYLAEKA